MKRTLGLLACALLAVMPPALAADEERSLGTGIHYSTGDYGTSTETSILAIPLTGRYDTARWSLRLWVPYLEVSGATSVVPGVGAVPNANPRRRGGGTASTEGSASGLGDIVASATYSAHYDPRSRVGLDVTGKVKLATADRDEGLGTGEHDFALLAEVFKTYDRVTFLAGAGHHWLGSSSFIPLRDVWSWSLGATYRLDARDNAGLLYDQREAVAPGAGELSELTAFLSRRLDRAWKAQAYVLMGLANGSPDWGAGLTAAYAF